MDNFKNMLFLIIAFAVVALLGYWAFSTMDSGSEYSKQQKEQEIAKENSLLEQEISTDTESTATETENKEVVVETNFKHQVLIAELQELINDNINMKLRSRGTRVGTVQNFLNIYNGTTNKIDNAYGEGMKKLITAFQSATGLPATGEAGPNDFLKMIEWLKVQN